MFALVDCNNFYVSCERLFAPHLHGKPVIVLSNNDGCAIARSEEAKSLGINMGTPAFMINELIEKHGVEVFSSNYTLYGDMSERVFTVLREFAPRIEVYSIDEAFLDLSSLPYHDLTELAIRIRRSVYSLTGIPVTIGIAPTKTLAKMSNRYAKKKRPDMGVHAVSATDEIENVLRFTKIKDIWGIGKQHGTRLVDMGFVTAHDLLRLSDDWMRNNMSVVGQRLLNELRGISCIPLEDLAQPKKNICTSRSFGKMTRDKKLIQEAIASHAANCARRLREEASCARKINVFIQTNPHRGEDQQYFQSMDIRLPVASNITGEIIRYANQALQMIFRPGYNYMKCGVTVLDIVPQDKVQGSLFDSNDRELQKKAAKAFDGINKTFGRHIIKFAREGFTRKWKLKAERLSPCYTTNINQLVTIRI